MRPDYKTLYWLSQRWQTRELMRLQEGDIATRQRQVEQVDAENQRVYEQAKVTHQAQRDQFRVDYPRSRLTNYLKQAVEPPPDLVGKWQRLLKRRQAELRRLEDQKEEKRAVFLERMTVGRYRAMQRRERAVRDLINRVALAHDIALSERAIDLRLKELMAHFDPHFPREA
jgi:hypothetical protein